MTALLEYRDIAITLGVAVKEKGAYSSLSLTPKPTPGPPGGGVLRSYLF